MTSNKNIDINQYLRLPWHYCSEASEWEGEKGYWLSVVELPDCSTFASTLEEGLMQIPGLLKEYLTVALKLKAKITLPEQASEAPLTGKLLLRLPASLHLGVKNASKREKTSINQFAVKALTEAVTKAASPISFASSVREASAKYITRSSSAKEKAVRKKITKPPTAKTKKSVK